jgi:hypothetical protein
MLLIDQWTGPVKCGLLASIPNLKHVNHCLAIDEGRMKCKYQSVFRVNCRPNQWVYSRISTALPFLETSHMVLWLPTLHLVPMVKWYHISPSHISFRIKSSSLLWPGWCSGFCSTSFANLGCMNIWQSNPMIETCGTIIDVTWCLSLLSSYSFPRQFGMWQSRVAKSSISPRV